MRMRNYISMSIIFLCFCFSCQNNVDKSQKIWLHRANDIEKAQYFQDKYSGLEIDITFVDSLQTFLVLHGGGHVELSPITLEQWFDEIWTAKQMNLWLDFKNLNNNNKVAALNELNRLCSKYKVKKGNFIVESWNASCLTAYKNAGFQVSFYIPNFKPQSVSKTELQKQTDKIRRIISENNLTTISGYYYQYQYMRDSFPDKDVLIWYHLSDTNIRNEYIQIANADPKVKVLLVAEEVPADYID